MGSFSLILGAGILALISGYVLFKLAERGRDKEFESHNALQILMFFLLISSLFLVGKASYDDRHYCDYVVNQTTIIGNQTVYEYDYMCSTNDSSTGVWLYKIPLFIIQIAVIYLILYLFKMIYKAYKNWKGDSRDNE